MKFKHTYKYFILFIILASCTGKKVNNMEPGAFQNAQREDLSGISWKDSVINFGKRKMGDTVVLHFRFKNTGKIPLVIKKAETRCSCTNVYAVVEAVPPGAEAEIKAVFDTRKSIVGFVRKTILITTNTFPEKKELLYGGEITGHKTIRDPAQ